VSGFNGGYSLVEMNGKNFFIDRNGNCVEREGLQCP
jgi:hypothetical protein